MSASGAARLRAEEDKLARRIDRFCHPRGMLGYFTLVVRRRRLFRALRTRFEVPYAMFVAQRGTEDRKRPYKLLLKKW
ncbi:MAG: hypothetical protein R3F19_32885 [Verrucomicrobiales bacterium]